MKRSDFLKSLSALPLGIFAGNEIMKSIGQIDDKEPISGDSTINLKGLDKNNPVQYDGHSIHRPDLVETFIKRTRGKIGNTRIHKLSDRPTFTIRYQGDNLIEINNNEVGRRPMFGKVNEHAMVVKTHKTKTTVDAFAYSDSDILKGLYDDLKWRIVDKNNPQHAILYSVLLTPPIHHPDSFESLRSIMFRGTFISL